MRVFINVFINRMSENTRRSAAYSVSLPSRPGLGWVGDLGFLKGVVPRGVVRPTLYRLSYRGVHPDRKPSFFLI